MPRTAKLLPAGLTIAEKLTIGNVAKLFPKKAVLQALAECHCPTKRERELPNDLIIYLAVGLGIYRDVSNAEVLRKISDSLQWLYGDREFKITGKSGISQARSRVGFRPLQLLYKECAIPLANKETIGAFYNGLRLVILDGTTFSVEDTEENADFFKRSSNQSTKKSAYPQARVACLAEAGTRACFDLCIGKYTDSELVLAKALLPSLKKGMLCMADMLFMSYDFFKAASETGAELLFRSRLDRKLQIESLDGQEFLEHPRHLLPDGSYTAVIFAATDRKKQYPMRVRVIDYEVKEKKRRSKYTSNNKPKAITPKYRLFTTILDPKVAPAQELAKLYHQRWEVEMMLDELKTHMNVDIIRSRTPELVQQEMFGIFMAHYAVQSARHEAAARAKIDPDELSFTHTLNVLSRAIQSSGSFPPCSLYE